MRDLNELFALCEFWEKEVRPRLRWEDCESGTGLEKNSTGQRELETFERL